MKTLCVQNIRFTYYNSTNTLKWRENSPTLIELFKQFYEIEWYAVIEDLIAFIGKTKCGNEFYKKVKAAIKVKIR